MQTQNTPPDSDKSLENLARIAEMLAIDISRDDLAKLSNQLRAIDALDESELQDIAPILKLDAGWHD